VFDAGDVLAPLAQRGGPDAVAALLQALDDPQLPKLELLQALAALDPPPPGWRAALLRALRDPEAATRAAAVAAYAGLIERDRLDAAALAPLLPLLRDRYAEVRRAASEAFGAARGAGHVAVDGLLELAAHDSDAAVRRAAIRALGPIGDPAEAFDRATKASVATRARPVLDAVVADAAQAEDTRAVARETLALLSAGSQTHTKVLAPAAPGDAAALARLRARDIAFTEDAFWRALGERDVDTVRDLLAAGLSPRQIDADGMPPLHFAVMGGCDYGQPTAEATRQIVSALLAAGADPNQREPGGDNPALHRATSCDGALVKQLLAAKADPRARNGSGLTAFPSFVLTSASGAAALLDGGYRPDAKERATLQSMLAAERDPARKKLLTRALAR